MRKLSTFISNTQEIDIAISAGAVQLIIDTPALSLRHMIQEKPLNSVLDLAHYAKSKKEAIQLSLNMDILVHQKNSKKSIHIYH